MIYMIEIYNKYYDEIPMDFELLLKSLGHKTRIHLVQIMMDDDELSLSRISKTINLENSLIINHIKKLELAGVVQNYIKRKEKTNEYSFYKLTKYGKEIISKLIKNYNNYFKNFKDNCQTIQLNYTEEIPKDFELTLKAISNKTRYALSLLIINNGPFSFSEITNLLKKEKSSISNHLRILETAGIIQNFLEKKENTKDYSFYKNTNYGKIIVSGLLSSYNDYYKTLSEIQKVAVKERSKSVDIIH